MYYCRPWTRIRVFQHRPLVSTAQAETAAGFNVGQIHGVSTVPVDAAVHAKQLRVPRVSGRVRTRQRDAVRDQDLPVPKRQHLHDSR